MGSRTNKPSYPTDEMRKWQNKISTLNGKIKKHEKKYCPPNVTLTPEMKRIEDIILAKKGRKHTDANAASSTGMTRNCIDIKVSNEPKRDVTKHELQCPICGYTLTQTAAFIKHMRNNHGKEWVDNINVRKKCKFCGIMVDEKSFNYHIQTQHTEIYERKI